MTRLSQAAPSPMFPGAATCGREHHPPGACGHFSRVSIIARVAKGMNVAEICAELGLSFTTVLPIYKAVMDGGWDRVRRSREIARRAA
jgi:hypothetical protein